MPKKNKSVAEKAAAKEPAKAEEKGGKERVPDWGAKGFFRAKAVIRLTSPMLGTTPSTAQENLTAFYRDEKGNIFIPSGYLRGALRDSAHFIGVPKTVKDVLRVSNVKHDFKGKPGLFQYTGSPSGRGVIGIYESMPAGTVIEAEFICPKVKYDLATFRKHLKHAGEFCGLGSLRKQHSSGMFEVVSVTQVNE